MGYTRVNELSTCTQTSCWQNTWYSDSNRLWPFIWQVPLRTFCLICLIKALSIYLQTLLRTEHRSVCLVGLPAAESAGNQPKLQRWYTEKQKGERTPLVFLGWHKAGRCGKPQLLHSLRFENMKVTTTFDLQTWIRLSASEKNWFWKLYSPIICPSLPIPPSIPPTLAIQTLIWKRDQNKSPCGRQSYCMGQLRPGLQFITSLFNMSNSKKEL